jgi:hypothetical protein
MATSSPQPQLTVASSAPSETTIQQLLGARTKIARRAPALRYEVQQRMERELREFAEQAAQQVHAAPADFDARVVEPLATRVKALTESGEKSAALFDALDKTAMLIEKRLDEIKNSPDRDLLAKGLERERQLLEQERLDRRGAWAQLKDMIQRIDQDLYDIGSSGSAACASNASSAQAATPESSGADNPPEAGGSAPTKDGGGRKHRA